MTHRKPVISNGFAGCEGEGKFKKPFSLNTGWWFQPTPLKNDGVKVSWDDDIPNTWKVIKFHGSSHHQPEHILNTYCPWPGTGFPKFWDLAASRCKTKLTVSS
jgi:hypothetical protein